MFSTHSKHARLGLFLATLSAASFARGAEPDAIDEFVPTTLAEMVLTAESRGDLDSRNKIASLLTTKTEVDELGMTVLGKIRDADGQWRTIDESIRLAQTAEKRLAYAQFRTAQPNSIEGHWNVVQYCNTNNLREQRRAHLLAILDLEPQNSEAHRLLGHQLVDGQWISQEQTAAAEREEQAFRESVIKYGQQVAKLANSLGSERRRDYDQARKQLFEINSPDAIPAVALVFAGTTGKPLECAIDWFGENEYPDASIVLARWAIAHPDESARNYCGTKLVGRSFFEYVPVLLDATKSPISIGFIPSYRADGSLAGVRRIAAQEGKDSVEVNVLDSVNQRLNVVAGTRSTRLGPQARTPEDLVRDLQETRRVQSLNQLSQLQLNNEEAQKNQLLQLQAANANLNTAATNQRVAALLSQTAGTSPTSTPAQLWDWWSDYTEREPAPIKFANYRYQFEFVQSSQYTVDPIRIPPPRSHECFVAGTSVVTSDGNKNIESVSVGDHVLAKDIETGLFAWDLVVATTNQPPKPTFRIETHSETLQCTGGHLFWVSGKGWTKARELLPGDILHSAGAPLAVRARTAANNESTFNLVTEKHHNYFVGENRFLTHDFEEHQVPPVKVPGLHLVQR